MSTKLYVGNLSFQTQQLDLRDLFAQHGEVISADIVMDRETGRSRGFGFVEMQSDEDGEKAIAALNGRDLDGRALKVNVANPRNDSRGDSRGSRRY